MNHRLFGIALGTLLAWLCGLMVSPLAGTAEEKPAIATATGWPMLGGTLNRNMTSPNEKNITFDFSVTKGKEKNIKWTAELGKAGYGGLVVSGGKVFIGTNNERPRDPRVEGDKGVLMCFNAEDGKFLWQATHDKLPDEAENDGARLGVISTPCVDGNRVYYVSNRADLVCADVNGDPSNPGQAKILWTLDMIKELDVFPCQASTCSPIVLGDMVYTLTGNGVNITSGKIAKPMAPSFIAVDKKTGKLAWKDASPADKIMEGQWSNPCAAMVEGSPQVIVPFGDGWLRAFEPKTGKLLWKFDCNPRKSTYKAGGRGDRNYFIATPVVHDNKVYIGVGRDPDIGTGVGHLWCIDITKKPANKEMDLSPVDDNFDPSAAVNKDSGLVWHYGGLIMPAPADGDREFTFGRTTSTVCIQDGLLYVAEVEGFLHCLDAKTGKKHWIYDLKGGTWNAAYHVDGKVILGTESGDLLIFSHGKELQEPTKIDLLNAVKSPPVAVGGVLYITNGSTIFAVAAKK